MKDAPGNREWLAFGGVVLLKEGDVSKSRLDRDPKFENLAGNSTERHTSNFVMF